MMEDCNSETGTPEFFDTQRKTSLEESDIQGAIICEQYYTVGKKTTVCVLTLVNGFEVIGTSSCVDVKNYSEEKGAPIARKYAVEKIWMLEGYLLQTFLAQAKEVYADTRHAENTYCKKVDPEPQAA